MGYELRTGETPFNSHAAAFDAKHRSELEFMQEWDRKPFLYEAAPGSALEDILYGDGCDAEQKVGGWFIMIDGFPMGPYETEAETATAQR